MARFRPLALSALILGLVALAALGVRQVIVGQEANDPPSDERQFAPADELDRFHEGLVKQAETVGQFLDEGGDVCSLPGGDGPHGLAPHPDLPTLINDVQLIVTGRPLAPVVEVMPTYGARVLTIVEIDDVLSGEAPGPTVKVESAERVQGGSLTRSSMTEMDPCNTGRLLLLLNPTERPGEFGVGRRGWARIEGGTVEVAPRNEPFQDYASADELLAAVRQIAQEHADLPKGLLLCQFKRTSPDYLDPLVCPGDSFNPYQAFRLSSATAVAAGQVGLQPGPQLSALLSSLDTEVRLEPVVAYFSDATNLEVLIEDSAGGNRSVFFSYVPSIGLVQLEHSGGQFAAPPEFQQAMEPFLTQP